MLPLAKKVALAIGLADGQYNLLQVKKKKSADICDFDSNHDCILFFKKKNNGPMAHQVNFCDWEHH